MPKSTVLAAVFLIGVATSAEAYVGPGLGAGTIAVVLGIIGAAFLAIVGVVWYPLKRLIKGKKKSKTTGGEHGLAADRDSVQPPR